MRKWSHRLNGYSWIQWKPRLTSRNLSPVDEAQIHVDDVMVQLPVEHQSILRRSLKSEQRRRSSAGLCERDRAAGLIDLRAEIHERVVHALKGHPGRRSKITRRHRS